MRSGFEIPDKPGRTARGLLISAALAALALVSGCASGGAARLALPDNVHWVRNSAEYRASLVQVYAQATRQLERAAEGRQAGTWVVVSDADETVISNADFQKQLADLGEGFSQERWAAWVHRKQAPPLPGSVAFLRRVRELGGRIAIVTGRHESLCPSTEDNFRAFSIPFDVILCRPAEGDSDKQLRFDKLSRGTASPELPPLEIVMWLGDNIRDFPGLSQDLRHDTGDWHTDFGSRMFVFPNPMYGSWEDNPRR